MTRYAGPSGQPRLLCKRRRPVWVACLAVCLIGSGCSSLRTHQLASHDARGDDAWIAAQSVPCRIASHACSQQHLIRGDACFRLAEAGEDPAGHYTCAADELETGLSLTLSGDDPAARLEMQERLCESLMKLQALQSAPAAGKTAERLAESSRMLFQLAPGSVPAVYYLSATRLLQIEPRLPGIGAADRLPVCTRLKRTVTRVLSVMQRAAGDSPPEWDRFAERYHRLAFDLGTAMRKADCR